MKKWISVVLTAILLIGSPETALAEDFTADLTVKSGYSAEELAAGLKGNLVDLAGEFVAAEEKYGVNAVFLAGLAALESGWGRHCFRPNNFFGWGKKSFDTPAEGIDFVAEKIAAYYLSKDGKYYHGVSLSGVNVSYNGSKAWTEKVGGIMQNISKKAEAYREEHPTKILTEEKETNGRIILSQNP